jgi:Lrp/AsnC family transcriptional regulator for asnA, asnC and gidA
MRAVGNRARIPDDRHVTGSDHRELDAIELRLIALLQTDGRMSTQALAKGAGCSEVTARKKLRRLLDEQVIQIVGAVDPFRIGYESPVIIGLRVEKKRLDAIALELCDHPAIRYVGAATGQSDLIIEVVAASNHELADFVLNYLTKIDGVQETHSSLILRIYKQSWNWGVRGIVDSPRSSG